MGGGIAAASAASAAASAGAASGASTAGAAGGAAGASCLDCTLVLLCHCVTVSLCLECTLESLCHCVAVSRCLYVTVCLGVVVKFNNSKDPTVLDREHGRSSEPLLVAIVLNLAPHQHRVQPVEILAVCRRSALAFEQWLQQIALIFQVFLPNRTFDAGQVDEPLSLRHCLGDVWVFDGGDS